MKKILLALLITLFSSSIFASDEKPMIDVNRLEDFWK